MRWLTAKTSVGMTWSVQFSRLDELVRKGGCDAA